VHRGSRERKGARRDDPKLRALEAYILAQRKGKQLNYGKH
jgi:hypothetical protein